MTRTRPSRGAAATVGASVVALLVLMSSCSDDSSSSDTTASSASTATGAVGPTATTITASTTVSGVTSTSIAIGPGEVTTSGISAERCAANKAAGKITYLTGFDFAAAASMADVIVAKDKGYFAKMCLDVEIRSSFSTANYPLVAANTAQFGSGGSYAELLRQSGNGAELEAVVLYGRTAIEALLVPKSSGVTKLSDLKGKTIGVKGDLPPVIVSMLNRAGLVRGKDYKEVLLDGFDPKAHLDTGIDALPVYKSNEPGQLTAAGGKYADYTVFDPSADGTPGSFGLIFTSSGFAEKHPSAVQDFVRADLRGWQDAAADPDAAVATAVKLIDAAGNPNFLSATGESFRWKIESNIVSASSTGSPVGVIDATALQAQVDAYTEAKVFATAPAIAGTYSTIASSVYDSSGKLIWPAG